MSAHHRNESSENHRRAAELHDRAAQAHRVAQKRESGGARTSHEHSLEALELSQAAHTLTKAVVVGRDVTAFDHDEIAALAYEFWQARGCPFGSPEEDWFRAERELRDRASKR